MTQPVVTADSGSTISDVARLMRDRNVGSVVVLESDRPAAVITDRDIALAVVADGVGATERVGDHATRPLVTGETEMDIEEAAALMVQNHIRRLPILGDGGDLAGIVTIDDLAIRAGDLEVAQRITADVARGALPEFFFHQRGG